MSLTACYFPEQINYSMKTLGLPSRIVIAIASLSMIGAYFLPVWFIYLMAPQYPEGLTMNIWLYKLSGQVDIINGLNHYIGMKHIKAEMFPELTFLVYILGFFILCGLIVAWKGKRSWLFALILLTVVGGAAAMYDFFLWGYDYGHNLDPTAAIQIPGFSYQPPLIGHKTLLNFDAYSYPDSGGWIIIVAGVIFMIVWWYEWLKSRKAARKIAVLNKNQIPAVAAMLLIGLASCNQGPKNFNYGEDICEDCNMTIVDEKFGAQLVTKKGKVLLFDDVHCLAGFLKDASIQDKEIDKILFIDYNKKNSFIDKDFAVFVYSPQLKSPMNSHIAAATDKPAAEALAASLKGETLLWPDLLKSVQQQK